MAYEPFVLSVELSTPAILNGRNTLDGVIAAALYAETGRPPDVQDLPFRTVQGIPQASGVMMLAPALTTPVDVIQSMKADIDLDATIVGPRQSGSTRQHAYPKIDAGSGRYRNRTSFYIAHATPLLIWQAYGDIQQIKRLIDTLPGLGAKPSIGWGQIASFEAETLDITDADRVGLVDGDGTPMRALPLDLAETLDIDLNARNTRRGYEPVTAPYWRLDRSVSTLAPSNEWRIVKEEDIETRIGLN